MPRPADPNAKEALSRAARAEFSRRGLRGARIEDITAACGLSKGAFYLHYPSKEALFGELVQAFQRDMFVAGERRRGAMRALLEKEGAITRADVEAKSPLYLRLVELDTAEDLQALELMWNYRDVIGVLITGAQGTEFETTFWEMADGEAARVAEMFSSFQCAHACRRDIPGEIFGALIVGTYLLLGQRMAKASEKPDLAVWARSLHLIIREGMTPPAEIAREPQRPARKPAARKPALPHRRTP